MEPTDFELDELEEGEGDDLPDIHLDEAYTLHEEGKLAEALSECDTAVELGLALVAEAYNLRGIVLEELQRPEEALESYRRALQLQPGMEDAAENLDGLEAELGMSNAPVTLASFASVEEAYLARGRLEVEGIWSFVADENFASTFGPIASRGVRLMVRESDVGRAVELLGLEIEDDEDYDDDDDEFDDEFDDNHDDDSD